MLAEFAAFVRSDLAETRDGITPRLMYPGLYFLRDLGYANREWGITPRRFLEIVHELDGLQVDPASSPVQTYKPFVRPFIRRYMNALHRPQRHGRYGMW
jgi:hypothetical protein